MVGTKGVSDCAFAIVSFANIHVFSLHTLVRLQCHDDTSPCIHYAFTQGHNVINHVEVRLVILYDIGRGL